jgi:hypothetical protein
MEVNPLDLDALIKENAELRINIIALKSKIKLLNYKISQLEKRILMSVSEIG